MELGKIEVVDVQLGALKEERTALRAALVNMTLLLEGMVDDPEVYLAKQEATVRLQVAHARSIMSLPRRDGQ
jgi:hypothetical protein